MAPKPFLPRRDIRKVSKDLGLVGLLQRVGVRPAAERVTADVLVGLESRVRVQAADQEVSNEGRVGGIGGHFRSIEFRLFPQSNDLSNPSLSPGFLFELEIAFNGFFC